MKKSFTWVFAIFLNAKLVLHVILPGILAQQVKAKYDFGDLLSLFWLPKDVMDIDECKDALNTYIKASANFEICSLGYTKPFHVCLSCKNEYLNFTMAYQDLIVLWNSRKCRSDYSKQIVDENYEQSCYIWNFGNCDECFQQQDNVHGYAESNETLNFINEAQETIQCFERIQINVCSECKSKYKKLGQSFQSMYWKHNRRLCSDLNSMMNHIVDLWKYRNKCQIYLQPILILLVFTGVITISMMCFYLILRCTQSPRRLRPIMTENRFSFSVNCKGQTERTPLLRNGTPSLTVEAT